MAMAPPSSSGGVAAVRMVLASILISAVCLPSIWQSVLDKLYNYLCSTTLYRLSTFETIWTVFCFAASEHCITCLYLKQPERRFAVQQANKSLRNANSIQTRGPKGLRKRLLEAVTYVVPLLVLDLSMIKKFAGVSLEDMLISGNYDAATVSSSSSSSSYHRPHFLVPSLHKFTLDSPLQTRRALPAFAPSSRRLVFELVVSFFLYDMLFFLFHLALHTIPLLRPWHMPHHAHNEMHPQITNELSVPERLGLVLLANFSLNIIGSHVLTRTLFVPLFVWLLVEIHSGMDLDWAYHKILPRGWGGGAAKHAKHHEDGRSGLEPFFGWCDALLDRMMSHER